MTRVNDNSGTEREGPVIVVTGIGGMGLAIARRLGSRSTLVLADVKEAALSSAAEELRGEGYDVVEQVTDVSDEKSVAALADVASNLGRVDVLAHTAGLSPVQAPVDAILRVDLRGTALMLDAFASVIAPGGAGVFIASMAGTMHPHDADLDTRLATTPTADLLDLPELSASIITDPGTAYMIAKRANQARVRTGALVWGRRGARVNSISPGIIATPMGNLELGGPSGEVMRALVAGSPTGRVGTPHDIASAVEFLVGPQSSFITGTDLLVDGGVVASILTGQTS
ncbi:MAG TPA: SDR family oxidoreductase [Acidimicrobiales bacterium]|jgi:NAD(P)-dependent dehydrogenase (short-subunit alcohol dehydrogenase family)|nr:SDR family oxidoreductase [Acidimicrobiales bacterium]